MIPHFLSGAPPLLRPCGCGQVHSPTARGIRTDLKTYTPGRSIPPPPAQISSILVDLARAKMFKFKPKNCRFVFVLVLEGRAHRIKSCCDAMLQPKNITTPSDLDILFSGILLLATIHGAMCNGSHIPKTYFSKWMNVAGYISDLPEECLWHLFGH